MSDAKPAITPAAAVREAMREGMTDTSSIADFVRERHRMHLKPSEVARLKGKCEPAAPEAGGDFTVEELAVVGWALKAFASAERMVAAVQAAAQLKGTWGAALPPKIRTR